MKKYMLLMFLLSCGSLSLVGAEMDTGEDREAGDISVLFWNYIDKISDTYETKASEEDSVNYKDNSGEYLYDTSVIPYDVEVSPVTIRKEEYHWLNPLLGRPQAAKASQAKKLIYGFCKHWMERLQREDPEKIVNTYFACVFDKTRRNGCVLHTRLGTLPTEEDFKMICFPLDDQGKLFLAGGILSDSEKAILMPFLVYDTPKDTLYE